MSVGLPVIFYAVRVVITVAERSFSHSGANTQYASFINVKLMEHYDEVGNYKSLVI